MSRPSACKTVVLFAYQVDYSNNGIEDPSLRSDPVNKVIVWS